jgi:hypothetical protein
MTESIETIKAFVREDDTVTIVCPSCKMPKDVSVTPYKDKTHFLKVRCRCETVFRVHLDFRRFYRKETDLPGIYRTLKPAGHGSGTIRIKDISQGGLGFSVDGVNTIDIGHQLLVTFELDDKRRTALRKEVIVQSVSGNLVGCRFSANQPYEKELGFYLKG